jgi:tocopherol cyclase
VTPLSSYRRTGADPPFGDPRRAHGTRFEGYYWRLTDVAAGRVAIVLCGVCRDAAGPWAIVAFAASDGLVRSRIEPLAEVSFGGLGVRAGRSVFASAEELRVDLGADARLELRLEESVGWPTRVFGGIGPAQIAPGLPQYWHPHLLGARVVGSGWDGATIYAEKNWGPRFTEHWWWGQAQGFPGADACVAFAGGRVLGGAPTSVVVRVEDRVLRLSPPFAGVVTAVGEAGWRVRARSPRWTVELEGAAVGAPAVLPVPVPGERRVVDRSQQYLAGTLSVRVWRGRRLWWSGESALAGLERWI